MQNRTYNDLYELVQALCGVVFASIEETRIKALINRRAQKAYRSSNYWTRFLLIGEEFTPTNGVVLYNDPNGQKVDTFLRIYKNQPYANNNTQEYEFTVNQTGAQLICGTAIPDKAFVTCKTQFLDTYGNAAGNNSSVPNEWFQYIAHGTYSDYLRAEGQQERAALADQEAGEMLLDELMRLDEQHTQTIISNRISTNSNMQYRSY
jgi:hypothetical protein